MPEITADHIADAIALEMDDATHWDLKASTIASRDEADGPTLLITAKPYDGAPSQRFVVRVEAVTSEDGDTDHGA